MRKIKPLIEMLPVTNNEGQIVFINEQTKDELQREFDNGVWMCIVKDIDGNTQAIILPDNF